MSRPSPLEHLPRLMAEADKTIAELRGEIVDLRERLEEVERDRNGLREQHSAIVSTARAIELERDEARAHHDHLRRSNDQLATQLRAVVEEREQLLEQAGMREEQLGAAGRRFGQLERERDGLRSTVEYADLALRTARTQLDDAHTRARRVREVLQGHYEMGDVDWPALFAELDAISPSVAQPWIDGSLTLVEEREGTASGLDDLKMRDFVHQLETALREQAAAVFFTVPRESAELVVRVARAPLYKPLQREHGVVAIAKRWVAQNQLITTADVELEPDPDLPPCPSCGKATRAIDRIGSAIRHVNDENGMPRHAVRINTPGRITHADGTTCEVPSFEAAAPALREAFDRIRAKRASAFAMRDRISRRIFGDATVAATAATMLLECLQTLRARLAHASTELQHRAEPAPEIDDVGAACAVLAEDLDGIVIEIDRVLEAVPR